MKNMKILVVDNDKSCLEQMSSQIKSGYPESEIIGFTDAKDAIAYGSSNHVDAAFTEIAMDGVSGLSFAKQLREHHPAVHITFLPTAYGLREPKYLLRPITAAIEIGFLRV